MKLIQAATVARVEGTQVRLPVNRGIYDYDESVSSDFFEVETVFATFYKNDRTGEKEWVGITEKAKEQLGFPFNDMPQFMDRVNVLEKELSWAESHKAVLEKLIRKFKAAGFLARLRYLFTGKLPG